MQSSCRHQAASRGSSRVCTGLHQPPTAAQPGALVSPEASARPCRGHTSEPQRAARAGGRAPPPPTRYAAAPHLRQVKPQVVAHDVEAPLPTIRPGALHIACHKEPGVAQVEAGARRQCHRQVVCLGKAEEDIQHRAAGGLVSLEEHDVGDRRPLCPVPGQAGRRAQSCKAAGAQAARALPERPHQQHSPAPPTPGPPIQEPPNCMTPDSANPKPMPPTWRPPSHLPSARSPNPQSLHW